PLAWTLTHSGNLRVDMRGPRGERYMFDVMPANIQARIAASIKGHLKSAHLQMSRTQLDALIGTPPILSKLAGLEAGLDVHGEIGDFDLRMDDLLLSPKTPGPVDDILGRKISTVSIKGQLENWITLEREGAQAWAEKNSHIRATGWQMLWGPADMIGDFDFTIKNGLPEGVIHIRIKHADALIDKIAQAGQMQASDSQKAKGFLKLIRPDADGRKPIELTIRDGVLRYGFIPLANLKD
ncbi:MAG TPA: DUF2125 domain-containing protein, partial [Hellea balneolensis]|nr:DUF2125 domain-containing protein [Hellea balneolensis]